MKYPGREWMKKYPGRPERVFIALVGILALAGFGCMAVGYFVDQNMLLKIGRWLGLVAIVLAYVPLILSLVLLLVKNLRPH